MTKKSASNLTSLASILAEQDSQFKDLLSKANKIKMLSQHLKSFLEQQFVKQVKFGNYSNNSLTLITTSSATATRLRMMVPDLLRHLQNNQTTAEVRSIRVRVIPDQTKHKSQVYLKPAIRMSHDTAQLVEKIAVTMDDEDIAESLLRISKHSKP